MKILAKPTSFTCTTDDEREDASSHHQRYSDEASTDDISVGDNSNGSGAPGAEHPAGRGGSGTPFHLFGGAGAEEAARRSYEAARMHQLPHTVYGRSLDLAKTHLLGFAAGLAPSVHQGLNDSEGGYLFSSKIY